MSLNLRRAAGVVVVILALTSLWLLRQPSTGILQNSEEPSVVAGTDGSHQLPDGSSHDQPKSYGDGSGSHGDKIGEGAKHTSGDAHKGSSGWSNSHNGNGEQANSNSYSQTPQKDKGHHQQQENQADGEKSSDGGDGAKSDSSSPGTTTEAVDSNNDAHGQSGGSSFHQYPKDPENYEDAMTQIKRALDAVSSVAPGVSGLHKYIRSTSADLHLNDFGELPPTVEILKQYLQVSPEEAETLKKTHAQVMDKLPEGVPEHSFEGRGIVLTGGGKYFPMALTAVRWIRESDKETPIEVFMQDESEYEKDICDGLFPKINARCRVLRNIYGKALSDKLQSKYALKPLSILASKFNDIYFMDADSYPLHNLSPVFDSELFKENGLLLSSDYWTRYVAPSWYDIVGIKLGDRARGNANSDALLQSDRENAIPGRSTESGQMFVRKDMHIKSLVLTMYYNLYGPEVYFPLLMMGSPGEGDKDTYAAASFVCGEPWYQTQSKPKTLGHIENGNYKGYAMVQPDPLSQYEQDQGHDVDARYVALHANIIKANPMRLLESHKDEHGTPPIRKHRFFGSLKDVQSQVNTQEDLEKRMFVAMEGMTCDWIQEGGYVPIDWRDGINSSIICYQLREHIKWLEANPDVASAENPGYAIDDPLPADLEALKDTKKLS